MSNSVIPHLLSDSPPPIAVNVDEDDDDEFGDFTGHGDLSFDENLSTPSTPKNCKNSPEVYSSRELNNKENGYKLNENSEHKSIINDIENELDTRNYINILDHIENRISVRENHEKDSVLKVKENIESSCKKNDANTNLFDNNCISTESHDISLPSLENEIIDLNGSSKTQECINSIETGQEDEDISFQNFKISESTNKFENRFRNSIIDKEDISERSSNHVIDRIEPNLGNENLKVDFIECRDHNDNSLDNFDVDEEVCALGGDDLESIVIEALESRPSVSCQENSETKIIPNEITQSNLLEDISLNSIMKDEKSDQRNGDIEKHNVIEKSSKIISEENLEKVDKEISTLTLKRNEDLKEEIVEGKGILEQEVNKETVHPQEVDIANEINNLELFSCEESDDDFGEFKDFSTFQVDKNNEQPKLEELKHVEQDDFAEFSNFQSSNEIDSIHDSKYSSISSGSISKKKDVTNSEKPERFENDSQFDDDFDDFTGYSTFNKPADDDFSEVSNASRRKSDQSDSGQASENFVKICKSPEEALNEAEIVLGSIFEPSKLDVADCLGSDFTEDNSVFENLKDITETNALKYQWGKSTAQKNILKNLNIDIRNILYGPAWNSGVPIFASNLCSTPLEPMKSDISTPLTPQKVTLTSEADLPSTSSEVPVVEFDWNGAGLTNPLDYSPTMLLDLTVDCSTNVGLQEWDHQNSPSTMFEDWESLGFSFETPENTPETTNIPNTNDSEVQRSCLTSSTSEDITSKLSDIQNGTISINQIQLHEHQSEIVAEHNVEDDFSDFASCQPKYKQLDWNNKMLPLRESHIFYQAPGGSQNILVPETNVKPNVQQFQPNLDLSLDLLESKIENVKPVEDSLDVVTSSNFNIDYSELESFSLKENTLTVKDPLPLFDEFQSYQPESNSEQVSNLQREQVQKSKEVSISDESKQNKVMPPRAVHDKVEDDEFTDFHSSLPKQPQVSAVTSMSFPEPLQPAVLQPIPVNNQSVAKIEWPEPGLDEDEINRIVSGCWRGNSESEKVKGTLEETSKEIKETKQIPTNNDDEEWTDFVSVKEPVKSRTSTPDLPLSVFNLGNIQPVKAPTPMVTPNGLVSSPVKKPAPNVTVPKTSLSLQSQMKNHTQQHPFITSKAFDALYGNPGNNGMFSNMDGATNKMRQVNDQSCNNCGAQPLKTPGKYFDRKSANIGYVSHNGTVNYGQFQSALPSVPKNGGDDDEWGDFVSASNTPSFTNSNFNSAPRIITNPSHNMAAFNKKASPQQSSSSSRGTVVRQERRNIPSISALPDLEFVSPKTRSARK